MADNMFDCKHVIYYYRIYSRQFIRCLFICYDRLLILRDLPVGSGTWMLLLRGFYFRSPIMMLRKTGVILMDFHILMDYSYGFSRYRNCGYTPSSINFLNACLSLRLTCNHRGTQSINCHRRKIIPYLLPGWWWVIARSRASKESRTRFCALLIIPYIV